ncbi:PIG-L family deacetylase [Phormidesmis priestleyi ULC007]|uniref:PIG-L family deacetylase n=2 Tax=Phormidesmis priestleyi TaxID=268141 RepID=A0A2T1DLD2_9CYAN|nr:PIG-L family deacetylase [Phormidesmis priestleyi ULC007]PZO50670.1 MAG: PIG-L family deacetylase [Phormidesmis priestleyi]
MLKQAVGASLVNNSMRLPFRSLTSQEPVLVVAPHPDDETLGCGGAIALLRLHNCPVSVLVISDGTQSHPRSRKYPAPVLQQLRQQETLDALTTLGVDQSAVTFLRLPDGAVSTLATLAQHQAECGAYLKAIAPKTIFLPWRHDPHPDHRATWQLVHSAITYLRFTPRLIEYPIWDWDSEQSVSLPNSAQITGWRLDIKAVVSLKQRAIAAYRSQITDLIDDDPEGFRLTPEMLANFTRPWEVYFEEIK